MDQKKQEKIELFKKLYNAFVEECLEMGIGPMPMQHFSPRGIFPYMDFVEVKKEDKEKMLEELKIK